jgi:GNAT superfamily N-acetyltransferase
MDGDRWYGDHNKRQEHVESFVTHASWLQRRTHGMRVDESHGAVVIDSDVASDTFNIVCRARRPDVPAIVERMRGRPWSWWVAPDDEPGDLAAHGLAPVDSSVLMRASALPPIPPCALRVERVTTRAQLAAYANVTARNGSPPDPAVLAFYERTAAALFRDDCPIHLYLGWLDHVAVATAEATVCEGVTGVYNVATLAEYRRRGFGTAMTLHAAHDGNGGVAELQASEAGFGIYRRIGFVAYGKIVEYKFWSAADMPPLSAHES